MNKFLLKILILCVILTGSSFAFKTEAQESNFSFCSAFFEYSQIKECELMNTQKIKDELKKKMGLRLIKSSSDFILLAVNISMQDSEAQKPRTEKNSNGETVLFGFNSANEKKISEKSILGGWESIYDETIKDGSRGIWLDVMNSETDNTNAIKSIPLSGWITNISATTKIQPITQTNTSFYVLVNKDTYQELEPEKDYFLKLRISGKTSTGGRSNYASDIFKFTTTAKENILNPNNNVTINTDTTYTPLAPISETLGGCTLPDGTIKENCIDTAEAGAFGKYFNALIRIFIGFCAVLAMIMIVVGGMQYMTSELISGKEEAKKRIWGAVGGLILALASYAILNTINPQLLDISLSGVAKAEIELQEEAERPDMAVSGLSTGNTQPTKLCSEGLETIKTNTNVTMFLCKKISQQVKNMIEKAKTENIVLAGGSYRSTKQQEGLRIQNCGGRNNIFNKNAKCTPPTATPGSSRHEHGLAVDFTCDGALIRARDNKCFVWLQKNALSYGLKNFDKEPWHWSFDGR